MSFSQQRNVQRLGPNMVLRPNKGALDRSDVAAPEAVDGRRRMVVVGATGMLGHRVVDVARVHGWDVVTAPRAAFDLRDLRTTTVWLERTSPAVVVNCAAYTNVDAAEEDEPTALAVNGEGAGNLARVTAAIGARIVHVSTDYVFRGDASEPYAEDAPVDPQGAYGRTKLAGERLVAEHNPDHLICRTSWLFGSGGGNFVDTMLRLAGDRDEVSVVADQHGCPTWTGHLAPALVQAATSDARGIAHLCGDGRTTWHGLAEEAFRLAGTGTRALPVTTADFPRPAPRPAWSVMTSTRADVPRLPDWREGLRGHLDEAGRLPRG